MNNLTYAGIGLGAVILILFLIRMIRGNSETVAARQEGRTSRVEARAEPRVVRATTRATNSDRRQDRKDAKLACRGFGLNFRKRAQCLREQMAAASTGNSANTTAARTSPYSMASNYGR